MKKKEMEFLSYSMKLGLASDGGHYGDIKLARTSFGAMGKLWRKSLGFLMLWCSMLLISLSSSTKAGFLRVLR